MVEHLHSVENTLVVGIPPAAAPWFNQHALLSAQHGVSSTSVPVCV
ncbi:MAG: hypothetical protein ACLRIS_18435 [Flavonifractor plautii]